MAVGVDVKAEKITATSGRKNLLQTGADGLVPGDFSAKWQVKRIWIPSYLT